MRILEKIAASVVVFLLFSFSLLIWTVIFGLWFGTAKADYRPTTYICESAKYSMIYGKKNCGKAAAERAMRLSTRRNYQAEIGGKLGRREAAKAIRTYECRERV